jgi:hypothetical protein
VLFGGFPKHKFNILFYQIALDKNKEEVYKEFRSKKKNEFMVFDFH